MTILTIALTLKAIALTSLAITLCTIAIHLIKEDRADRKAKAEKKAHDEEITRLVHEEHKRLHPNTSIYK
jgi:hypothetical protein